MEFISSPKSDLLLFLSKQQHELKLNTSILFFKDYQDLMDTLHAINKKDYNIFKFIYDYKNSIHSLLCDLDVTINISDFILKFDFAELYYLDLLIAEDEEIINYVYNFEILKSYINIIKKNEMNDNFSLYKIVNCKILLDLIKNFCDSDNYDEDIDGEEINKINKELQDIIKINIYKFNELFNINEENMNKSKLDDLYVQMLISLIKSKKFHDYNFLYNIFHKMELEKINIGNSIQAQLQEILNINNDYINKFIIKSEENLYDEATINFYYILLNFILKDEFFIYQIPFLFEMKKRIIEIIKSNKFKSDKINNLSKDYIERYKYVIETFSGPKYYIERNKEEINKLKTVLEYFKLFYFESKVKDIENIKQDIKNKNINSKYLKYYQEAAEQNNIYPIIKSLYFKSEKKEIKSERILKNSIKKWKNVYRLIKDRKITKLRNKQSYSKYFKNENNQELLLKYFIQEEIDFLINFVNSYNKNKKHSKINSVKDENINNELKANKLNPPNNEEKAKMEITIENSNVIYSNDKFEIKIFSKIKTKYNGFIKEINKDYFILVINENKVHLFNKNSLLILKINDYEGKLINAFPLLDDENNNEEISNKKDNLKILLYSNNYAYVTSIDIKKNKAQTEKYDISKKFCHNLIQLKNNKFLIVGKNCIACVNNLEKQDGSLLKEEKSIINSILINEEILALISKSDEQGTERTLKFFNIKMERFYQREIKGYSFIESTNGLALMTKLNEEKNYRILLCACKNINGILLVNLQNEDIENTFYNTKNLEVSCFCPIIIIIF